MIIVLGAFPSLLIEIRCVVLVLNEVGRVFLVPDGIWLLCHGLSPPTCKRTVGWDPKKYLKSLAIER